MKKKGKSIEFRKGLYADKLDESNEDVASYLSLVERRRQRVIKYYKLVLLFILVAIVGVSFAFKTLSVWAVLLSLIVLVMLIRANNKF